MTVKRDAGYARVRVPATSANLGPGFDALGLALAVYDDIAVRVVPDGVTVTISGEGADDLPTDSRHLVVRSMNATFEAFGERPPGLRLECHNNIPQARGLGSSSAAIVAGVLLARALVPDGTARMDDTAVLALAAALEGHPDNVAPCLLGGFTIAWSGRGPVDVGVDRARAGNDGVRAVRLTPAEAVRPVVFVPTEQGLTSQARAALPATVPHADAAYNTARAALLVHALTAAPELLVAATDDRLHQPYRAGGAAATAELVTALREDGVAAVVSGAGPSVLALAGRGWVPPTPENWLVWPLDVDLQGSTVTIGERSGTVEHAGRDPVAAGRAG